MKAAEIEPTVFFLISCNNAHDHCGRNISRSFSELKKSVLHGERILHVHVPGENQNP